MNLKNVVGLAVLILAVTFAFHMLQHNDVEAQQTSSQRTSQQNLGLGVEYARLQVEEDGDSVTWLIGGNQRVRTETVKAAYRRLGGQGRGTFADLLNQIGAGGWNLIQKDGNIWIFSRRGS